MVLFFPRLCFLLQINLTNNTADREAAMPSAESISAEAILRESPIIRRSPIRFPVDCRRSKCAILSQNDIFSFGIFLISTALLF